MKQTANARFTVARWDENPYSEGENQPKLTRASVTKTYTGDIVGEGRLEYLMMYRADGSASFVGHELVVGELAGRSGSFVLERIGRYEEGRSKESFTIVPGSATGALLGLSGRGSSDLGHGSEYPFALEYELPA